LQKVLANTHRIWSRNYNRALFLVVRC
jgi:hypothetical protein